MHTYPPEYSYAHESAMLHNLQASVGRMRTAQGNHAAERLAQTQRERMTRIFGPAAVRGLQPAAIVASRDTLTAE